jgi:hypothetical protein
VCFSCHGKWNFLCLQVGGRNTVLERARNGIPFVSDAPTIIFGADVTHPAAGEDSSASIAAVSFLFSAGNCLVQML